MKISKIAIFVLIAALLCTCKPTDLTPVYIHITSEDLENCIDVSNFNESHDQNFDAEHLQALKNHTFTHANVYVNNKNLGCWELPCKVPVLDVSSADSSTLVIIPAFPMTGMANTISGYPFLNILRQKVILKPGTTYEVSQNPPKYIYSEYIRIPYFETFSNSTSFTPSDTANNNLTFLPTIFDGKNVGEIVLNNENGLSFDVVSKPFIVPTGSYRIVLEVRYKTDAAIDVGLKMSTGYNPYTVHSVGGFYASPSEWKTIHFDLTNTINTNHNASSTMTELNLILTGVGNKDKDTKFEIDDIKVIYIRTA